MLTAGAIMTTDLVTVRPMRRSRRPSKCLLNQQISGLPVTDDDGRLVGVITEFALLAVAYDKRVKNHTVSQHMTRDVITVDIDDPISRVADLCIVHRVRRVPVMKTAGWSASSLAATCSGLVESRPRAWRRPLVAIGAAKSVRLADAAGEFWIRHSATPHLRAVVAQPDARPRDASSDRAIGARSRARRQPSGK